MRQRSRCDQQRVLARADGRQRGLDAGTLDDNRRGRPRRAHARHHLDRAVDRKPGRLVGALNSMVFIITGSGARTAVAYDLNPAAAPLLHIEYVPKRTPVVGNISIGDVSIIEGDTGTKTARRS